MSQLYDLVDDSDITKCIKHCSMTEREAVYLNNSIKGYTWISSHLRRIHLEAIDEIKKEQAKYIQR